MPNTNDKYFYASGQLMLTGAMFLFNLFAAKLVGPEQMGIWQTITLISTYGMILTIGVINGMGRNVPFYRGKGDELEVRKNIATTLFFLLIVLAIFTAVLPVIYFLLPVEVNITVLLGVVLLGARVVNTYSVMLIRSFRDFRRLGTHQAMTALVLLITIVPLFVIPDLHTIFWGVFLSLVTVILLSKKYSSLYPRSRKVFFDLLRTGFPIYIVGLCFIVLTTIDRVIVLGFLGTEQLGIYIVAAIAMAVLLMAPALVSNVMYPKLAEIYGSTGRLSDLVPQVIMIIKLNFLFTVPIAIAFFVAFYLYVIPVHMDAYLPGRDAMAIILGGCLFIPVGAGFGDLFNVIGLQARYLRNTILGVAVNVCTGWWLVAHMGAGLEGAAAGTLAGLVVFTVLQVGTFINVIRVHNPETPL